MSDLHLLSLPGKIRPVMLGIVVIFSLLVAGCASAPPAEPSEKEIYELAQAALKSRNFAEATRQLNILEKRFPFGRFAEQAQLDLIYARYSSLDVDGALLAADRFVRLHPDSPNVDYAYYIRGIAKYNYDTGIAVRWFPVDASSRDAGRMRDAYEDFQVITTRFPDSDYAADSRKRMIAIRNRMARHELNVARYYIRREAYVAAVNRCQYLVENYPNTPSVEEALIYMVELYRLLGQKTYAEDALAILAVNYPESEAFDTNMHFIPGRVAKDDRSLASLLEIDGFD